MKGPFDLEGPEHGPEAGGAPRKLVLLLHGLGADGNDLIGLAPHWAKALPTAVFVSPNAPFPCDMALRTRRGSMPRRTSNAETVSGPVSSCGSPFSRMVTGDSSDCNPLAAGALTCL